MGIFLKVSSFGADIYLAKENNIKLLFIPGKGLFF